MLCLRTVLCLDTDGFFLSRHQMTGLELNNGERPCALPYSPIDRSDGDDRLQARRRRYPKYWRVLAVCMCAVVCLAVTLGAVLLVARVWVILSYYLLSFLLTVKTMGRDMTMQIAAAFTPSETTGMEAATNAEAATSEEGMGTEVGATPRHMRTRSMFVGASHFSVPPGATYRCFGPYKLPEEGMLFRFQPDVDMDTVHHMILYGSTSGLTSCRSDIIYAWARTGQTVPIGLDLHAESEVAGLGFEVGQSGYRYLSIQIHYQRLSDATPLRHGDQSGIQLTMSLAPSPRTLLRVQLNQLIPLIPGRSIVDQCTRCSVRRGGMVYAYRNHAHRLGSDIWSDHFKHGKREPLMPPLGLMSSQQPQIVRVLAKPRVLETGDVLQLHCIYNATLRDSPTGFSIDEVQGEMCNQYLFASPELTVTCGLGSACGTSPRRYII